VRNTDERRGPEAAGQDVGAVGTGLRDSVRHVDGDDVEGTGSPCRRDELLDGGRGVRGLGCAQDNADPAGLTGSTPGKRSPVIRHHLC
jgi:hypothetical protein